MLCFLKTNSSLKIPKTETIKLRETVTKYFDQKKLHNKLILRQQKSLEENILKAFTKNLN